MIRTDLIYELKRNRNTARKYTDELKRKRFKTRRVRNAIDYWEGNYDAFDRAIFLAEWYLEKTEVTE